MFAKKGEERMSEYDEFDKAVANHWSLPLLDSPHALVSVIETKIARAELGERRRIIALLESKKDDYYQRNLWADGDGIADAIALIKGENE